MATQHDDESGPPGAATSSAVRCRKIGVSPAELARVEAELRNLLGDGVSPADVFGVSANRCLLDAGARGDWAAVVKIYAEMSDLLRCEGRATALLDQERELAEERAGLPT